MAQCVEKPAVKPDNLSSKFRIHMVEREPILKLFSDLHMYNTHVCIHTIYKQRQNPKAKV